MICGTKADGLVADLDHAHNRLVSRPTLMDILTSDGSGGDVETSREGHAEEDDDDYEKHQDHRASQDEQEAEDDVQADEQKYAKMQKGDRDWWRVANRWANLMTHLVDPIRRQAHVDIFVCMDDKSLGLATVPKEIKKVIKFRAANQHERARTCWQRIGEGYDFYIKTRPDFVYYTASMDWSSLRSDRLYTRFRKISKGLRGAHGNLTSEHLSFDACGPGCRYPSSR